MTREEFLTKASNITDSMFNEWIKPYLVDRQGNPWQFKEPTYRAYIEIDGQIVPLLSMRPARPFPF